MPLPTLADWANEMGGIYRLRLVNKAVMVVSDPALFLPLLGSGDEALPKATPYRLAAWMEPYRSVSWITQCLPVPPSK